ncbi:30S ribosomal protein S18 [Anaerofustis stercorihominis]|uniref:30S ribosomal protein S18 n=1 Tax=Anaerofustis stercorihominis TaxID=214853 RepID=UPI0034385983
MAMQRQGGSNGGYRGGSNGGFRRRKKVCYFCENKIEHIDYKDTKLLKKYVSERYKILPRRVTGTCAKHQRGVTQAVNIARNAALLPYTTE